ncbi:basic proline-rich protein-like [Pseudopipra pipra]|uniref:basic proline-rich protein-like n=1 Tax=Pseudopipra pipra TaxID=415032 RepID=UPI0031395135
MTSSRQKHPGLTVASPLDTGAMPAARTPSRSHRHVRGPGPRPSSPGSRRHTPDTPGALPDATPAGPGLPAPPPRGAWPVSARPSPLPRREGPAVPARCLERTRRPAAGPARCCSRAPQPRPRSARSAPSPSPPRPLSVYLRARRPPAPGGAAGPGAGAGGAGWGSGARRPALAAAGRRRRPVAHSERRQQRGHVGAAVPPPASPRSARAAPPSPPRPAPHRYPLAVRPAGTSPPRCHWRSVSRSPDGPAQTSFPDWVSPLRFDASERTRSFSALFFHNRPRSLGVELTEPSVSERPRPSPPPSRRHIPFLPAARFACRPLAPTAATPGPSLAPAAALPSGREPARGYLLLIGRRPCQSGGAGGAAERSPARARRRSALRLVAGRARGARPPPCPTEGGGEYPYVRAMTSPPANQRARGSGSRPRSREPLRLARPGGLEAGSGRRDRRRPRDGVGAAGATAAKSKAGGVSALRVPVRRRGSSDGPARVPIGGVSGPPWVPHRAPPEE